MTRLYLALWIGLVACVVVAQAQTDPCAALKLPGDNSPIFDLSPLEHQSFVAYASTQFTTFAFTFGVCSTVACNGESSVSVCQRATNGVEVVAALWQPSSVPTLYPQFSGQTGIGIVYTYPANSRVTNLFIVCDPNAARPTNLQATYPADSSTPTIISLTHQAGCPVGSPSKKKGLSAGSVMLIILTVCLVLYFVLGFVYKRFRLGAEGVDAIPNFLWADLPGLVKDGVFFVINKIRGGSGTYETVA